MRKKLLLPLMVALTMAALSVMSSHVFAQWQPVGDKIKSKFAAQVNPARVHQEYPRPQMVRGNWQNLNGLWDYAIVPADQQYQESQGKILVPFPVESSLSGVGKTVGKANILFYKRTFNNPASWKGKRVLLHFGAVDWETIVMVNGKEIGKHKGGYSPFSFDITDALKESGTQELLVRVFDPTDEGTQPRGKQINNPHGIWYTAVTGIWQTVWLEAVPQTAIEKLKMVPSVKEKTLALDVTVHGAQQGDSVQAVAMAANRVVASIKQKAGEPLTLKINNPQLWSPDRPFLYDLKVSIERNGRVIDSVGSYFAMRDVALGKDDKGYTRIMFNGKFLFQHGPLDQGWWPDGLYTAPTDAALKYDIEMTKQMGYNMLRKHVKVEPARFYYWCDKLGILVWQDMPSGDRYIGPKDPDIVRTQESADQYYAELTELIETLYNYPSIVMWVPFNEGWGQFNTAEVVDFCKKLDPTRLTNNTSGWSDRAVGDVNDMHSYPGPDMPKPEENRAVVLGEYGGLGLPIEGHTWLDKGNWGYVSYKDKNELLEAYEVLNRKLHVLIGQGLSAAVYTQTTDVEIETNGLMTYDRHVIKFDLKKIARSNNELHYNPPTSAVVVPTSKDEPQEWRYTTEKPADDWAVATFDDSAWTAGQGGFGTKETPNTSVRTDWKTDDIWVRRSFELSQKDADALNSVFLNIFNDEDAEIYINGVLACERKGHTTHYVQVAISPAARATLKPGKNTIAVHCHQTNGGQYIDVGLELLIPGTRTAKPIW